jgi:hypothetical protein
MDLTTTNPTVRGLFKQVYQYRVPPYQRPYAWEAAQIDDFWNDISSVGAPGHFLGPMVLHNPGSDEFRTVIDGQQRITTLLLLLALVRDAYIELGDPPRAGSGIASSVSPHALIKQEDVDQFVLRSGVGNREVLEDFMLRHPGDNQRKHLSKPSDLKSVGEAVIARNKRLIAAYRRLQKLLAARLDAASPTDTAGRLASLRELEGGLTKRVTLVVLDLAKIEDAFLLFETLNERGLRLSAADLLKSHLLSEIRGTSGDSDWEIEQASDKWDDMVDALGGGDITGFLRHYLLMRHERVRKADVFPLFKSDVDRGAAQILQEVTEMGGLYAGIVHPVGDDKIAVALRNLNGTGVDTHRVVLLPARKWLDDGQILDLAKLVEVLSFRWSIAGRNAQVLESIYQSAAASIAKYGASAYKDVREALAARLPSDETFAQEFTNQTLGVLYVAAYALRRIEDEYNPGERAIRSPSEVHVEHVMPKTSTEFWRDRTDGHEYQDIVQRWGNLTLLLDKLNISVSNGDWKVKLAGNGKNPGYNASRISLTSDLVNVDDWSGNRIELRALWLAAIATRIWSVDGSPSVDIPAFSEVALHPGRLNDFLPGDMSVPAYLMSPERPYPSARDHESSYLQKVADEPAPYGD